MHSNQIKKMYKRNMLKNLHFNERGNQIKSSQYNKTTKYSNNNENKCNKGLFYVNI